MKCCQKPQIGKPMPHPPFQLKTPAIRSTAVVFAAPHSGRDYPWDFILDSELDEVTIRSSEDAYIDLLFEAAPNAGAPFLISNVPRAFVDLNRGADELDPALIHGVRQVVVNPRVTSGLGVIPRVVANGRAIRRGKITLAEAQARLEHSYFPYHHTLARLLTEARDLFGFSLLMDCHSMPREALTSTSYAFSTRPDVVLGDRFGAACDPGIIAAVEAVFRAAGLRTARNLPFAGAFVAQKYGKPKSHQHVVQIEIDRSLYMDEVLVEPRADFAEFQAVIAQVVTGLADIGRQDFRLAAQ